MNRPITEPRTQVRGFDRASNDALRIARLTTCPPRRIFDVVGSVGGTGNCHGRVNATRVAHLCFRIMMIGSKASGQGHDHLNDHAIGDEGLI